jgi:hypothetical protein
MNELVQKDRKIQELELYVEHLKSMPGGINFTEAREDFENMCNTMNEGLELEPIKEL